MGSGKKSVQQPILSLILLAVLGTIAVSILSIHSSFKPVPPPAFLEDPTVHSFTLSSPSQFAKAGPSERYDHETLFEKINGKAPLYLNGGFVDLQTQRFVQKDDSQQWFEFYLYDMTNDTNAFSVYSTQRRPDATLSEALSSLRHYNTENGLYLQVSCVRMVSSR